MTTDEALATRLSETAITDDTVDRLRHRLAERAAQDSTLDVAYRTLDSPVGPLLLAATPAGLVQVGFATHGSDVLLTQLAAAVSPRLLRAPVRLDPAARELDEYFAGRRRTFDLTLDWRLTAGFRSHVQHLLRDIPYGGTWSYGELAGHAGNAKAVRAAATACATNPLPIVVPCHRVLRADGSLGGYLGGLDAKRALLELEQRQAHS